MGESLPPEDKIMPWWRVIGALQGLLLGCVIVSLAWIVALLVFGVFHVVSSPPRLFGDASLLPWIVVMIAAFLIPGLADRLGLHEHRAGGGRARTRAGTGRPCGPGSPPLRATWS